MTRKPQDTNRLRRTVARLKAEKRKALVAYVTAGFPDLRATERAVPLLAAAGADIIEIGVPFSDAVADGPTIQMASEHALKQGVNLAAIFAAVRRIRARTDVPIILMTYLNPVYHYGVDKAMHAAAAAGVDGFIVPDIIPDESADIRAACARAGLSLVYLAAPTTPPERMRYIDRCSDSFVYIVSVTGVTGGRTSLPAGVGTFLSQTARNMKHPRYVGFGIARPEQAAHLKAHCDGVIVGSAIIEIMRGAAGERGERALTQFIRSLRTALDA